MNELSSVQCGVIDCFGYDETEITEMTDSEILHELTKEQSNYLNDYLS